MGAVEKCIENEDVDCYWNVNVFDKYGKLNLTQYAWYHALST